MPSQNQKSPNALIENLYPVVEGTLDANPKNIIALQKTVSKYLDRNMERLTTSGPLKRNFFSDADRQELYLNIGINADMVNRVIGMSSYIKEWFALKMPFSVACTMAIIYAKRHKKEDLNNFLIMYLILSMYPLLHAKYFPYLPKPEIMEYTINNLSNKYKIKQKGTIWNALMDTAMVCDRTYTKSITNGTDKDIALYIEAMYTRINALLKKVWQAYYRNEKDKNLMGVEQDIHDENILKTSESNSFITERIANSVAMKLAVSGPDPKLIEIAAKLNDVSFNDIRVTINQLYADKQNSKEIKKVITNIMILFLTSGQNKVTEIHSNKFILSCMAIYKSANTGDKMIIEIKKILDKWLAKYSARYKATNRVATLNSFRKALFMFFVFTIQAYSPN